MVMVCHHLNPRVPEDVAFAESRIRRETIAAEDVLHDLGAISAIGSDSQGMGRIGETIARTWQLASKMKVQRGSLPEDAGTGNDNHRIKRYVAKLTINPARIYGIDDEIGSLEVGKLADIVLWEPKFFGIKPEVVFKGGFPAWSVMGESNASLMTCEPLLYRPQWGAYGPARQDLVGDVHDPGGDRRRRRRDAGRCASGSCRPATRANLTKRDMLHNDALPDDRGRPRDLPGRRSTASCAPASRSTGCRSDGCTSSSEGWRAGVRGTAGPSPPRLWSRLARSEQPARAPATLPVAHHPALVPRPKAARDGLRVRPESHRGRICRG